MSGTANTGSTTPTTPRSDPPRVTLYDDASVHVYGVTDPALGAFVTIHVSKADRVEALTVDMANELCENLTRWLISLRKSATRGNVVTPETPKGTKRRKR